jgi:hypothetical protein
VAARLVERALARPNQDVHPESFAVTRDDAADPAVAVNAERFAAQAVADANLPLCRLERPTSVAAPGARKSKGVKSKAPG